MQDGENQADRAKTFRALHRKGDPVILFNAWDPGSAKAISDAGAKAIATGSWPVAAAHGFADGERIPRDLVMDNLRRIVGSMNVPVTADLESGYGAEPAVVAETVTLACEAGAAGFNFEDQIVGGAGLHDIAAQTSRIAAAREAADAVVASVYVNARTDIFLKARPDAHDRAMLNDAIERAKAFEQAGADGVFAPGLADEGFIGALCEASPLPVNIIALPHAPDTARLAGLGVARISYGPVPYRRMVAWLEEEAKAALDWR